MLGTADVDRFQREQRALVQILLGYRSVGLQDVLDLATDATDRIQGRTRILEDHGNFTTAYAA